MTTCLLNSLLACRGQRKRAGASGDPGHSILMGKGPLCLRVHRSNCLVLGQDLPGNRFNAEFAFAQIDTAGALEIFDHGPAF